MSQQDGVVSSPGDRQREILAVLEASRQVDVASLAHRFGVSGMTIRRDLAELDAAGQLHRVHGGAVLRRPAAYGSRTAVMTEEKARIARGVADLVREDDSIGLDTGTTCHAVAAELRTRTDLTVVTNALHAAAEFRDTGNRVVVLGGVLTRELTLVNAGVADALPRVHLDTLVLGCGGVDAERGLTYFDPAEVDVRRSLVAVSDRVVVAADHSKLGRRTAIALGALDVIDVLVTDAPPVLPQARALDAAGVEVLVAP